MFFVFLVRLTITTLTQRLNDAPGVLLFYLEFFGSTHLPSISAFSSFKKDFQNIPTFFG